MSEPPLISACAVLIVAAGRGLRAGGGIPKQYRPLAGKPMLRHAIEAFAAAAIDRIQCVIHPDDRPLYDAAIAGLDLPPPVAGGATRQDSVRLGLEALAGDPPARIMIHDAARPFASIALIDRVASALQVHAAVVPGLAVTDTLKRVDEGKVAGTVSREGLTRVQTPQGFRFAEIMAAHRAAAGQALTDDAAVAEAVGLPVHVVAGEEGNVKVTEPEDFTRAEARFAQARTVRIGSGFDVHAFGPGDHIMLCGLRIPHSAGLVGHSDADVGLHALTDALLGGIADGDIGSHFPPSDPRWRGADSSLFLRHAAMLVRDTGGRIEHVDLTIICERPKVGPHRDAMRERIAGILELPLSAVSVKATTTERLGFTGRGEGIAAQAVATLSLPAGS